ncbi:RNA polymerase II elongation factor ELL [Halotydeus destructor]|nr:RNA polymerase II elongation factor ELL [Halotydeus destructor]
MFSFDSKSPGLEDDYGQVYNLTGNSSVSASSTSCSPSKSLVFVKLTDSAIQAIEDYYARKCKDSSKGSSASIGFDSTLGFISFQNEDGTRKKFNFSLANVDGDGPQGSFECIRQKGSKNSTLRQLENLGRVDYKMQVHASDDSYQKTKTRMAACSEESKKHSAKVIKESGPNVGRKVRMKKAHGQVYSNPNGNSSMPMLTTSSASLSSTASSSFKTGREASNGSSLIRSTSPAPPSLRVNGKELTSSNNNMSSSVNVQARISKPMTPSVPANPELMKRPLRERIIHLLALRSYKKPELLAKVMKEGVKDKDKKTLGQLLASVAQLKDNSYHLTRAPWLEVNADDWPHYTTEEREAVRRRNPHLNLPPASGQNSSSLTAQQSSASSSSVLSPLSSDYSLLQPSPSPPSVNHHSAIPSPQDTMASSATNSNKRLAEGGDGLPPKKTRVSHHHQTNGAPFSSSSPANVQQNPTVNSNSSSSTMLQPRSKSPSAAGHKMNDYHDLISGWSSKPKSPEEPFATASGRHMSPERNGSTVNATSTSSSTYASAGASSLSSTSTAKAHYSNSSKGSNSKGSSGKYNTSSSGVVSAATSSFSSGHHRDGLVQQQRTTVNNQSVISAITSSVTSNNSNNQGTSDNMAVAHSSPGSPDSGTGSNDGSLSSSRSYCSSINGDAATGPHHHHQRSAVMANGQHHGVPDYEILYKEIVNREQRERYKNDFARDYEEYRCLHTKIDHIARKFGTLEERLLSSTEGSDEFHSIMDQIVKEYDAVKKDTQYVQSKKRTVYLHSKLAHIKAKITNFDENRKKANQGRVRENDENRNKVVNFNQRSSNSGGHSQDRTAQHVISSVPTCLR